MNPLVKTFLRRRGAAAAVSAAVMVAVLAGCAVAGPVAVATPAGSTAGTASVDSSTGWVRIVLRFDQEVVAASLADTPPAREFAAMLPLELHLGDPMGQAKSGPLPSPIDITGAATVTDPAVGTSTTGRTAPRSRSSTTTSASPCHRRAWFGSAPWTAAWTRSPTPRTGSRFASTWPTARASDFRDTAAATHRQAVRSR